MRVGIDANWAIYEKAGIGKYTHNLIKSLLQVDKKNEYVLFFNYFRKSRVRTQEIRELIDNSKTEVSVEVSHIPALIKDWLTLTNLPLNKIFKNDIDVYHAPCFVGVPKVGFPKTVTTIHDLAFLSFPEHRGSKVADYYLKRTKLAIEKSDKLIAVSRATKADLIEKLNVPPQKVQVIYEAVSKEFHPKRDERKIQAVQQKYHITDNYILSVCTLEPRKNLSRLVKAYAQLPHQILQKYKLVLVGADGWNNTDLTSSIADLNLKGKVILTGFVAAEDLPSIYQGAKIFVYPSFYEGFGLPVLEALNCGVPVITSDVSSLPEISGRAAILIDPYRIEQITYAIKNVLMKESLQKSLKAKGLVRASQFSWEKVASETIKIYQKLGAKNEF